MVQKFHDNEKKKKKKIKRPRQIFRNISQNLLPTDQKKIELFK